MLGPLREFVGVDGELGLQLFDRFGVFVEEDLHMLSEGNGTGLVEGGDSYSAVPSAEAVDALLGVAPAVLGHDGFEDPLGGVPELVVLVFQQHDHTRALRVERRGHVFDRDAGDLFDPAVGDRRGLIERVVCSARVDGVQEARVVGAGGGSGHLCCWCGGEGTVEGEGFLVVEGGQRVLEWFGLENVGG